MAEDILELKATYCLKILFPTNVVLIKSVLVFNIFIVFDYEQN